MRNLAARGLATTSRDDPLEQLAVLAELDRLNAGTDERAAVLLQDACFVQGDCRIEGRLATQGRQHRVGALLGDDRLDDLGGDRLDIGGVGELGIGHDRGRVGVDQDDPQALLTQDPAALRAGVVELAGLPDDDRAGPDDQDAVEVGTTGHQARPFAVAEVFADMSWTKRSKRCSESCGPAAASGWY